MRLLSYFLPIAPKRLVYMLQQVEYDSSKFADWVDTAPNLTKVQTRQSLDVTLRIKLTLLVAYVLWALPLASGISLSIYTKHSLWLIVSALSPLFCVVGLYIFNGLFGTVVVAPAQNREISKAETKLKTMTAMRIAVLGSYGKTTMKELLATVLAEGRKVASTPGNKNVLISHARWLLDEVDGDEEVLVFEYGEAEPGDIKKLAAFSQPDTAFVTGLAPAHMDGYGNLDEIGKDLASISTVVSDQKLFINGESAELTARVNRGTTYTQKGVDGWTVTAATTSLDGTSFTMTKDKKVLKLTSGLLGTHNVGPLAAVVALAIGLGLDDKQVIQGVEKTQPFAHRLQPYRLGGAQIIDDTYNGNLEGMKAGLELLKITNAKRKIYVTPGLVEQGDLTEKVHKQLGETIAKANPSQVVLMSNSTTGFIRAGLEASNFKGEVKVEEDPLDFYTNLEHFVAAGDLVLLQNDWTDNYS